MQTQNSRLSSILTYFGVMFVFFLQHVLLLLQGILLSQAAASDGLIYSVNYNGQTSGTQGYALPLFD